MYIYKSIQQNENIIEKLFHLVKIPLKLKSKNNSTCDINIKKFIINKNNIYKTPLININIKYHRFLQINITIDLD